MQLILHTRLKSLERWLVSWHRITDSLHSSIVKPNLFLLASFPNKKVMENLRKSEPWSLIPETTNVNYVNVVRSNLYDISYCTASIQRLKDNSN